MGRAVIGVGDWVETLDPVEVAKAALCEIGRPDLALGVKPNKAGNPSIPGIWPASPFRPVEEQAVIVRAFLLAHRSAGHDAERRGLAVYCRTCHPDLP